MWANIYEKGTAAFPTKEAAIEDDKKDAWPVALSVAVPVAVTPLDDIEALVERAALALLNLERRNDSMRPRKRLDVFPKTTVEFYRERAAVALTAAGIPCKQRRARK